MYRTIVFLVAVSPCALAASAVPATLAGISNLARHGVLFKVVLAALPLVFLAGPLLLHWSWMTSVYRTIVF
ncbi:hypothetical protein, partial [Lactiplantibacillus plantarum]|uniref:hypothetical protein n=1 Tax=Lactiplantibacillus plantarum TaxID=1590 RepID=UPI00385339B8